MKSNITMKPKPGESAERFIKRFCKKVKKFKIIEQVRNRRYYEKPSDTKRETKKRLKRKNEKNQSKTN
tara:strand:+ start:1740 stop:1943 length:204 start_codon:yes stop_codon:yes gene_type:complete